MIAIIDYGAGNLRNVSNAFDRLGIENTVTSDASLIRSADRVVLPGVGAFGDCVKTLLSKGLDRVIEDIISEGKPFLGICVGMQMLFEESEESPSVPGLGILKGKIRRIPETGSVKIPHMGWNDIRCRGRLFEGLPENPYMYFVHSYYLDAEDKSIVSAKTFYGTEIEAAVEKGNLFATQFHPEKSSSDGLKILSNFAGLEAE